jgi:hypothetical protein
VGIFIYYRTARLVFAFNSSSITPFNSASTVAIERARHKEKQRRDHRNQDRMPSIIKTTVFVAGLVAVASALPAQPKLSTRQNSIYNLAKRQNAAAAALGLADVDILQL